MRNILLLAVAALTVAAGCDLGGAGRRAEPAWVGEPEVFRRQGRFLTALGTGGPGPEAEKGSDRAARERLAQVVSGYTEALAADFLSQRGVPANSAVSTEFIERLSAEVSTAVLRRSVKPDAWRDAEQTVHTLYRVPVAVVHEQIIERARAGLSASNPFEESPSRVAAAMGEFLRNQLKERLAVAQRTGRPAGERTASEGEKEEAPPAPEEQTPEWLQTGRVPDYPTDRFITAIGLGPDLRSARTAARRELADRAHTRLRSTARSLRDGAPEPLAANLEALGHVRFSSEDLVAVRDVTQWHDDVTDTHYTLAALQRETAASLYLDRARSSADEAARRLDSVPEQRRDGKYGLALLGSVDAVAAATRAVDLQLKALVVAPDGARAEARRAVKRPILPETETNLRELMAEFRLEPVGGDRQWVRPGEPPPEPLVVKVVAGPDRRPVPGVPVLVRLPGRRQAVHCEADSAGLVRCPINVSLPAGDAAGEIGVTLDLERLAESLGKLSAPAPVTKFRYAVRSRENLQIAVHLWDEPGPGTAGTVVQALRRRLREGGFQLLPRERLSPHVRAGEPGEPDRDLDLASLLEQAPASRVLLAVTGSVRTRRMEAVEVEQGTLEVVYCDYELRARDPSAPEGMREVFDARGRGRGAYVADPVEAAQRARREAADAMAEQVLQKLRQKLRGPD